MLLLVVGYFQGKTPARPRRTTAQFWRLNLRVACDFRPRSCGHLSDPWDNDGQGDDGKIVPGCLLVSGGDPAKLLKFAETAFDEVPLGVELLVERVYLRVRNGLLGITATAPSAMKRRKTLFHSPNTSGRSRQGEPVRTIQSTPSTNIRLSRPEVQRLRSSSMMCADIRAH
jgi:hypothetical protein